MNESPNSECENRMSDIQKRLDLATPAPWFDDGYRIYAPTDEVDPRSGRVIFEYKHTDGFRPEDACLTAWAPADLRWLLSELRRVTAAPAVPIAGREVPFAVGSAELKAWLRASGIEHEDDKIRRIVIDLKVGEPARIYLERYADKRLLRAGVVIAREEPGP